MLSRKHVTLETYKDHELTLILQMLILYAHHQLEHWRTSIGPQVVAIAHLAGLAEENVVNVLQPPFNWYAVGRILSLLRGGAAAAVHGEVLFK